MSAKDRLLNRVGSIVEKIAAAILWKYVDTEGTVFYLSERVTNTIRSPFTGRSFTPKPIRQSLSDIGKELRSGDAKIKGSLWRYVDPEGKDFYYDQRLTGTVKSPFTGKTFPAKPQRFTLSQVGKELKLELAPDPASKFLQEMQAMLSAKGYDPAFATTLQDEGMGPYELEEHLKDKKQFEINYNVPKKSSVPEPKVARERDYAEIAEEIIKKGEKHDAIKVIKDAYDEIIKALDECEKASKRFRELGLGATEDATVIMQKVQPKVLALAKVAGAVAKELEQRLGGA
jgi:hypothetical protein